MRIACTIGLSAAFGLLGTALAHHSDAGYDQERVIGFEGTVTRYLWRNPHVTVYVETRNEAGELVELRVALVREVRCNRWPQVHADQSQRTGAADRKPHVECRRAAQIEAFDGRHRHA